MYSSFQEDYEKFMQSEEWQTLRQARLKIDRNRCAMCGRQTDDLQVHHMRYGEKFGGREDPWTDLVSLCPTCHEAVHALMNRPTGQRDDGSVVYGWSDVLPRHIRKALEKRGLM